MSILDKLLGKSGKTVDPVYENMRTEAFSSRIGDLKDVNTSSLGKVFGAVVDMPVGENTASLICFIDGRTSLGYSYGHCNPDIGKKYADVRQTVKTFLQGSETVLNTFAPTDKFSISKSRELTYIYLLTQDGVYVKSFDATEPSQDDRYLYMLFQNIITHIRLHLQKV